MDWLNSFYIPIPMGHYKRILLFKKCTTMNIIISLYFKGNNLILRTTDQISWREIKLCKM